MKPERFNYTREMKTWVRDNYLLPQDVLAAKFNEIFGVNRTPVNMNNLRRSMNLMVGKKGRPKSGGNHFSAGKLHPAYKPVGSEVITNGGYIRVKVADPNVWKFKHTIEWEQHNGPVPDNHTIAFVDGDGKNCRIDNLMLVTRREAAIMNRWYSKTPREYKPVSLALARIKIAITDRLKS